MPSLDPKITEALRGIENTPRYRSLKIRFHPERFEAGSDGPYVPFTIGAEQYSVGELDRLIDDAMDHLYKAGHGHVILIADYQIDENAA